MPYASVVLDIATRQLDGAFTYAVPPELAADAVTGATVLVTFSHRAAVGYVVSTSDEPPADVPAQKISSIEQVLAPSAFDDVAARVAAWMAHEYACPLCEAIRPFLAPGQKVRVTRSTPDAPWELVNERAGAVDARWAALTPAANDFTPAKTASRQRAVIEALRQGPSAWQSSPPPSRVPRPW